MTRFEKYKKDLTYIDLIDMIRIDSCVNCPINDLCNHNEKYCEEVLKEYFRKETGKYSKVTNFDKFKEGITLYGLIGLINGKCYICPIENSEKNHCNNCTRTLKEYFEQESESEGNNGI